ncbi:multicomponent Na+:H+ antiporter subunit B [Pseudochelatococcus lubricantis]|uniref:Multicomponent Na+:H+ antiporter subunit B n=1 Tax=Pseudochelatococcus lubricantis TaxID=1538102 RepID=A0ABX0V2N6_9HYPH|nr:hydrogen gas-evolving membrane-bound hydrogenase subunit E [Pseudochelatococcus lubricantis]NIJ59392.1 multicomponent Na+:H+ antiporter subunit B [Pseudochelatococcus lubricantis]
MRRQIFNAIVVALFGVIFAGIVCAYDERQFLRPLAEFYVTQTPLELGLPNIVTGILITWRGFDTLGEVAVLFMVAASVGLLLRPAPAPTGQLLARPPARSSGEIVETGAATLLPLIFLFGAYVIANGHLSAGGGFQGGAIVASGVVLLLLARPLTTLPLGALAITESLAGVLYVSLGLLGVFFAGGFLDSRFLPAGEFGAFVSAGAIPAISILLGVKVGAELSVIVDRFRA